MAAAPTVGGGPWVRLTAVRRFEEPLDLFASLAGAIAACHARQEAFQAILGRPNLKTGQCLWLYGNLFAAGGAAGHQHAAVDADKVRKAIGAIDHWVEASFDVAPARERPAERRYGPEDVVFGSPEPVVWVVSARPVPAGDLQARVDEVSGEIGRLEAQGAGSKIAAERSRELLELIEDRAAFGLWEVDVAVGSTSDSSATSGLFGLTQMAGVPHAAMAPVTGRAGWLGTPELTPLVAFPQREVPGIRVVDVAPWDQVPEVAAAAGEVAMGTVLAEDDLPTGVRFAAGLDTVNRHVFVTGATGSGKSETVRTMLAGLADQGVPWLVIEPAKAEYHHMTDRVGPEPLLVLRPGDRRYPAGGLNPLEPTVVTVGGKRRRFPLQTHVDLVRTLFDAAFDADEPFPQILSAALERSYRALGWDLALGMPTKGPTPQYPTLRELRRHALAVVDDTGYGREVRDNVRGFIEVRLGSLEHGTPGRFFSYSHDLDLQALAGRHVVLQLENIGNDHDQAFVLGAVLIRWIEMLRLLGPRPDLGHVLAIEEAHRLLRAHSERTAGHAVEMLANLLAEVRAYGEGVIVAEQIPSKIVPDVVKNSALKVMHRLPAEDDRAFVGATMNLDEPQSRAVVAFRPGEAAVHADGMDRPVRVQIDLGATAGAGDTGDPPLMVRSPVCRAICGGKPCPPRQIARAHRVSQSWELRCWADLAVVAHLAGRTLPSLREVHRRWARNAAGNDEDRLACGLAGLVDASVRARWRDVAPYADPPDLVVAVTAACLRYLVDGEWPAARPGPEWQVRECRWIDIEEELMRAGDRGSPHAETAAWQARAPDLELPAVPVDEQLAHVRARHTDQRRDPRAMLWGEPPVMDAAPFLRDPEAALDHIGVTEGWAAARFAPQPAGRER